jgi:hypothetical protein
MNIPPSKSESESSGLKTHSKQPPQVLTLNNIKSIVSKDIQNSQILQPYLEAIDSSIMRKSLLGNPQKTINFCDTNISKKILKTRDFQEFRQQSIDSDIKTPLSQEINENNIFDQITLKTDRVKQNEKLLCFPGDLKKVKTHKESSISVGQGKAFIVFNVRQPNGLVRQE